MERQGCGVDYSWVLGLCNLDHALIKRNRMRGFFLTRCSKKCAQGDTGLDT